ncbi:hypothetical protein C1I60_05645 [Paenibacillus terrae]|uniref:Spore protein YkvP/CgeB glycosyl transferase-like domain-containing protein n=1 Tax=Paenibacillus terrae TaxID=159743 RepID=A0A4U2Q1C2_9BACL|nr:glycosyltransferase [Paenibacillus terrae]TKH45923.1 hypothetical protein C1I60_05645 [Paenibacillus terrae]
MSRKTKIRKNVPPYVRLDLRSRKMLVQSLLRTMAKKKQMGKMPANPLLVPKDPKTAIMPSHASILLMSALSYSSHWKIEQLTVDHLRESTKEVIQLKPPLHASGVLSHCKPDLLLVLGSDLLLAEDLDFIRSLPFKKAIWLADSTGSSEILRQTALSFDCVFTQQSSHIPFYLHGGCRTVQFLPFPADPTEWYPLTVPEEYRSEVVIFGDTSQKTPALIPVIDSWRENKKVIVCGKGWDCFDDYQVLPDESPWPLYLNGANLVLHLSPSLNRILEAASCGACQISVDDPCLYQWTNPDEDILLFHTPEELGEKLNSLRCYPEQRRRLSTQALAGSRFRYSYRQVVLELLRITFENY